jgi:hypothetical protein
VLSGDEAVSSRRTFNRRCLQVMGISVGQQEAAIHPHDTLVALAEVSAAFAGFSGIVAALGYRSPSEWSATAQFRFANLLSFAVAASLLAFSPIVLVHSAISDSTVWAWSSPVLGLF